MKMDDAKRAVMRHKIAYALEALHTPPDEMEETWTIDAIREARLAEADLVLEVMEV